MSVQAEFIEDDCTLVVTVRCKDITSAAGIDAVFDELNIALTRIQEKIGEEAHWYFVIDVVAEGVRPAAGEFYPYESDEATLGSRDPWKVYCPSFWKNAYANPQSRRRIVEWVDRLEETLKLAESRKLSTASLWEDDQTQLGEPLLTQLSLMDVKFVPYYTKLLRLWDMGHEVCAAACVMTIVNKHGITPETRELIQCYTEATGSDEQGLLELL